MYRVLGSKMSPSSQQQQQQQQHHMRPSLASMLSQDSTLTNDSSELVSLSSAAPRPRQPPTRCSDASPGQFTYDTADKSSDRLVTNNSKPDVGGGSSKIVEGSASSVYSSQGAKRLQKNQGRTVSQMFTRQSCEFGSMSSGLNYSLPQLNNIDKIVLDYSSCSGLNVSAPDGVETFGKRPSSAVEKPGQGEMTQAPQRGARSVSSIREFYNGSPCDPEPSQEPTYTNKKDESVGRPQVSNNLHIRIVSSGRLLNCKLMGLALCYGCHPFVCLSVCHGCTLANL